MSLPQVHYQQFLVDTGMVDCALVQFYWRYKGKSEADSWFGVVRAALSMVSVIVGPHDLARMIASMPAEARDAAEHNSCLVLEPTANPHMKAFWKAM